MEILEITSHSEKETLEIGKKIASLLKKGHVISLTGELGSGKTKFTEGVLTYFGLADEISSPTFTIVNEYTNSDVNIFHFDVYRLEDSSEFSEIGGDEYFDKGICIIEWGETIQDELPKDYLNIKFTRSYDDENSRNLKFISHGEIYDNLIKSLEELI